MTRLTVSVQAAVSVYFKFQIILKTCYRFYKCFCAQHPHSPPPPPPPNKKKQTKKKNKCFCAVKPQVFCTDKRILHDESYMWHHWDNALMTYANSRAFDVRIKYFNKEIIQSLFQISIFLLLVTIRLCGLRLYTEIANVSFDSRRGDITARRGFLQINSTTRFQK